MKLTETPATVIFPSNLHAALTGAWKLTVAAHTAELTYTDGTTESVPSSAIRDVDTGNWFAVVSKIQSMRDE
jgi:hypothetical protein